MDIATLKENIKKKKLISPIYIFSGPEQFLKDQTFQLMVDSLITEEDTSNNVFRIFLSGKTAEELIGLINSFAFNVDPRLFYIQGIGDLGANQKKALLNAIEAGGVPANNFLIFVTRDGKSAAELSKKFKQQSEKIDFWTPFANRMPLWIKDEAIDAGCKITTDGADLLLELVGADLSTLHKEIVKLAIAHKNKTVGVKEIEKSVSYLQQNNIFDFLNAFGSRNKVRTLLTLQSLLSAGEPIQKIWFMLCRQIQEYKLFHDILADRPDLLQGIKNSFERYRPLANRSDFRANQEKKSIISLIQKDASELPPKLTQALNLSNPIRLRHMHLALNFKHQELIKLWPELLKRDLAIKFSGDLETQLTTFILETL